MTSWFRMVNNIQIIFLCCKWHLLTCRLKLTDSYNICFRKKNFRCSEPIIWWIHCFYSLPQCTFRSINPFFIEYISNLMHSYFTPRHQLNLMKVLQLNSHTPSAENVLLMVFEVIFLYEFFSVSFLPFMSWRIAAQFACFAVTMFSCSNNVFPPSWISAELLCMLWWKGWRVLTCCIDLHYRLHLPDWILTLFICGRFY